MPENHFAGEIARNYDRNVASRAVPEVIEPTVECLHALAGDGAVLELAIGTGRVALPLAARGVAVAGIDLSADMLAELRAKPGADAVRAVEGDMTATRIEGRFSLAYLVFNTIMNLTTQDAQVACFANAARHLGPGGRFVLEAEVPDLRTLPPGGIGVPFSLATNHVGIDVFHDLTHRQLSSSRHLTRRPDGLFQELIVPFRYVWPSELDLMARLAGMTLEHRWADWDRSPFTGDSRSHVSVWRLPPPPPG